MTAPRDFHRLECCCGCAVAAGEHEISAEAAELFYAAHQGEDHDVTETFADAAS